jgi:putative ABC transport system substrate-binding protein
VEQSRRGFLVAVGVLATSFARGQAPRRIVILSPFHLTLAEAAAIQQVRPSLWITEKDFVRTFCDGLAAEGMRDGTDYVVDVVTVQVSGRLADGVRESLSRRPDLLVPLTTPVAQAVAREVHDLPVIFGFVSDPIASGLVERLARPGANVTGVSNALPEITGKLLQLVLEIIPGASRVAVLFNPDNPAKLLELRDLRVATKARDVLLRELPVRSDQEIEHALDGIGNDRVNALVILGEALTANNAQRLNAATLRMRLPVVSSSGNDTSALVSYSPDYAALTARQGAMAGKVLKGAKPSQLPVELPTKFNLVINLRAARTLGLMLPQSVLVRADEVIQ